MGDWATETSETKNLKDQIEGLDRKIDGYQEDIHDLIDTNEALQFSLAATSRKGENPAGSSSAGDEVHKLKREKAELERQAQALEGKLKQMRGWITSRGATSEDMSTDYLAGLCELLGGQIKIIISKYYSADRITESIDSITYTFKFMDSLSLSTAGFSSVGTQSRSQKTISFLPDINRIMSFRGISY
ncbi:uncharacterized protein RSE6_09771 [Rhynchosporium secalis]|uniref:Uncharacterized protein n=1 Tax=Rhynchosporium secalis TaxID=38038 RepID=A0A1E1MIU0_RHYSE|nr:uncharacterized protein RSE6_09771 [Rhynchosporium secalis]